MKNALLVRIAGLLLLSGVVAQAGDATWVGTPSGDSNWSTGANWSTGVPPGSTTVTNNTDTVTLGNTGTVPILIDQANQNIGSIVFVPNANDTGLLAEVGPLLLSSGGSITDNSSKNASDAIESPVVLEPLDAASNGTYTFANNNSYSSTSAAFPLGFESISGGTTTGAISLYLTGSANSGLNGVNLNDDNTITGPISDGGAAGGMSITIAHSATNWRIEGTNTYSGPTTVIDGGLDLTGSINSQSSLVLGPFGLLNDNKSGSQNFNGLAFNGGRSNIEVTGSSGNTLNLGTITRNNYGEIGFSAGSGDSISTSATNDSTGILGSWAFDGSSYATVSSGKIGAYIGATPATTGTLANMTSSVTNYIYSTSATSTTNTLTGNITGNTLQYNYTNSTANGVVNIANAGHSITLNGLLLSSQYLPYANNLTISGTGNVNIGSSNELDIVTVTANVSIYSNITGNGGRLSFAVSYATVMLNLFGNNTYTGGTILNSGWLNIYSGGTSSSNSAIGTGPLTIYGSSTNNEITVINGNATLKTNNTQSWNGSFGFGGTLNMGTGTVTLGTPNITLTNVGGNLTIGGNMTGTGNLTVANNAVGGLLLTGASINPTGSITNTGTSTGTTTISGTLGADVNGVTENSTTSALILSGSQTYSAPTSIISGTINAGSTTALSSNSAFSLANVVVARLNLNGFSNSIGSLTGGGTTGGNVVLGSGTLSIGGDNTSPAAYAGSISGSGGLTKIGNGTLTLSGFSSYSGGTTISSGTLSVASTGALGSGTVTVGNGTVLQYTGGTASINQNITVSSGTGVVSNTGGGVLNLAGTITKNGSVLNLAGGSYVVSGAITGTTNNSDIDVGSINYPGTTTVGLTTANSYNGPTVITDGSTLLTGLAGALPGATPSDVTLGASSDTAGQTNTLDLLGTSQTVDSITAIGSGTDQIVSSNGSASGTPASGSAGSSNTGSLTVNYSGSSTDTFTGSLGGSASLSNFSLTKTGTGTLSLSGSNTYTGATSVNGGTLILTNNLTSSSSFSAASGTTLDLASGNFSTSGTITNNGTLVLGNGVTLSSTGTFTNNGTLDLRNDPSYVLPGNFVNNGTILTSTTAPATDTPTMPEWVLLMTAGLLLLAAGRRIERKAA